MAFTEGCPGFEGNYCDYEHEFVDPCADAPAYVDDTSYAYNSVVIDCNGCCYAAVGNPTGAAWDDVPGTSLAWVPFDSANCPYPIPTPGCDDTEYCDPCADACYWDATAWYDHGDTVLIDVEGCAEPCCYALVDANGSRGDQPGVTLNWAPFDTGRCPYPVGCDEEWIDLCATAEEWCNQDYEYGSAVLLTICDGEHVCCYYATGDANGAWAGEEPGVHPVWVPTDWTTCPYPIAEDNHEHCDVCAGAPEWECNTNYAYGDVVVIEIDGCGTCCYAAVGDASGAWAGEQPGVSLAWTPFDWANCPYPIDLSCGTVEDVCADAPYWTCDTDYCYGSVVIIDLEGCGTCCYAAVGSANGAVAGEKPGVSLNWVPFDSANCPYPFPTGCHGYSDPCAYAEPWNCNQDYCYASVVTIDIEGCGTCCYAATGDANGAAAGERPGVSLAWVPFDSANCPYPIPHGCGGGINDPCDGAPYWECNTEYCYASVVLIDIEGCGTCCYAATGSPNGAAAGERPGVSLNWVPFDSANCPYPIPHGCGGGINDPCADACTWTAGTYPYASVVTITYGDRVCCYAATGHPEGACAADVPGVSLGWVPFDSANCPYPIPTGCGDGINDPCADADPWVMCNYDYASVVTVDIEGCGTCCYAAVNDPNGCTEYQRPGQHNCWAPFDPFNCPYPAPAGC